MVFSKLSLSLWRYWSLWGSCYSYVILILSSVDSSDLSCRLSLSFEFSLKSSMIYCSMEACFWEWVESSYSMTRVISYSLIFSSCSLSYFMACSTSSFLYVYVLIVMLYSSCSTLSSY